MKRIGLGKVAVAASAFVCATMLSVSWSEQGNVSLSTESAQARIGRPLSPMSVAGVARRQYRRAGYGYGAVGAGLAAGAVGTAAAVAATTPNWGWGGNPYYAGAGYAGAPYYRGGGWGARSAYYGAYGNNYGAYAAADGGEIDAVAYCMQRFRSYDPNSGSYLGYDGLRHACP